MTEARVRIGPVEVLVVDALIAAGLSVWMVVDVLAGRVAGMPALVIPLLLFETVPLVLRRQAPLLMVALMSVSVVHSVATANSVEGGPGFIATLVALYSLGAYASTRKSLAGLAIVSAIYFIHEANNRHIETGEQLWAALFFAVISAATFGAGLYVRRYREARELEREGERRARQAVADERARIARELHDIVSHSVSVMVLQAEAAEEVLERRPERASQPLRRIQGTGREALTEMRRMLDVLRADDDAGGPLAPQPGLAQLDQLAAGLRDAGVPVDIRVQGEAVPLPQGLDLAAYRVVQEALTNAVKHSGRAPVEVLVYYRDGALDLVVSDDGRTDARGDGGGHGLAGMRERVQIYNGSVEAGPRDEGGYRVRASLPLPAS